MEMDKCDYKSQRQDRYRSTKEISNPSFSSTLLDAIYRSIDENKCEGEEELIFCRETMRSKKQQQNAALKEDEDLVTLKRACLIEKWMEKKVSEKVIVRRKSTADSDHRRNSRSHHHHRHPTALMNWSSSSSDSSFSGSGLSSSEAESIYGGLNSKPKPIRTSISSKLPQKSEKSRNEYGMVGYNNGHHHHQQQQQQTERQKHKHDHQSNFVKTKSRALKIYSDLKKVKQPISPGGRLASFLNSLFTPGNGKNKKFSSTSAASVESYYNNKDDSSSEIKSKSACSSASSFSRSCLSKTPSTRSKVSNGTKRSVRFYPVSVIVDEDCRPCGHKSLYEQQDDRRYGCVAVKNVRNSIDDEDLKVRVMSENRGVEEIARDHVLKNYRRNNGDLDMKDVDELVYDDEDLDSDDEDDAASYASSDLFELDHLGTIGIDRYREELPVYETTHFNTNRAIANGLIV